MQVGLYEAIAIAVVTAGGYILTTESMASSAAYAAATSVVAIVWNYVYNTLFEFWESRQVKKGRSVLRRIVHALGFEMGFIVTLVPLMAWWFNLTLVTAFVAEIGIMVFFMLYTFAFNWAFDRVVGLPQSASPDGFAAGEISGEMLIRQAEV